MPTLMPQPGICRKVPWLWHRRRRDSASGAAHEAGMDRLRQIATAAAAYWAAVFAFAFVLGIGRTLWLAPQIGALPAVLCEVPLTLAASWWAARRLTARFRIAHQREALAMGMIAFVLLMLAEVTLAHLLTGLSPAQWLRAQTSAAGAAGLAGQVLFALMPWWMVRGRPECRP